MELIPIIKASLGIFTVITSITIMISYIIYKWKSRHRAKPYEIKHEVKPAPVVIDLEPDKNRRFEILNNEEVLQEIANAEKPRLRKIKETSKPESIMPRKKSENEVFNIYNFYSSNELRPMHKLKLKHAASE